MTPPPPTGDSAINSASKSSSQLAVEASSFADHTRYPRLITNRDHLLLSTNDNVFFHVSRKLLTENSAFFANIITPHSTQDEPYHLRGAFAKGLALVLDSLTKGSLLCLDSDAPWDGLENALTIADAYDIHGFRRYIHDEAHHGTSLFSSPSPMSFVRYLLATVCDDEEAMRQRAWETISFGIHALPKAVNSFFFTHNPLPLHRLQDLHQRYGKPWYLFRRSLVLRLPSIPALARFHPQCTAVNTESGRPGLTDGNDRTDDIQWQAERVSPEQKQRGPALVPLTGFPISCKGSTGCNAYRTYGGDFDKLRLAAANDLLGKTACNVCKLRRFRNTQSLECWAKAYLECQHCGRQVAQLFAPAIQKTLADFPPEMPDPPSWLHPSELSIRSGLRG